MALGLVPYSSNGFHLGNITTFWWFKKVPTFFDTLIFQPAAAGRQARSLDF